ncbi:hypothetical protein [Rhodococcus sp. IEGM 1408]|uniref:hypothetical protein n=1 Tax=Rhodococcus sp. IEGM 1408 TaxID=3082220 RepID=UPI0029543B4D|nr:hypothetical protein [Rhodococcus sp. IEGM 1408]MDV8000755.1 hypothetical protein [Rhodococcus sp. IEGM 1408]
MSAAREDLSDVTVTAPRVWHGGRLVERGTVLAGLAVKDAEALAAAGVGTVYRPPAR